MNPSILRQGHWFTQLPVTLQDSLLHLARPLTLEAGACLFQRGDAPCGLYAVLDGAVRIGAVSAQGKEAVLTLIEAPHWFGEIGLFDERFFLYFEETDLCLRARRAGWVCRYVKESRIMHIGSVSTGMKSWKRMPGYWFDSRLWYYIKNHGVLYAALATLAYVAGSMLMLIRKALGKKRPHGPDRFLSDLVSHALRSLWQRKLVGGRPTKSA